MRVQAMLLFIALAPLASASDEGWPSKGDKVYVAATFKGLTAASPVGGAQMQYDMPACAELEIVKANAKKSQWVTKDPLGGTQQLQGAWLPRTHKTKSECESQFAAEGDPKVSRSGTKFTISETESK